MIILDEPEIHLHPKWRLKYAEVLVLLQKEFDLSIILTTHSPYFLEAIETYTAKHSIANRCSYYLAELNTNNKASFENVTTNIDKIYDILASPFEELDNEIEI